MGRSNHPARAARAVAAALGAALLGCSAEFTPRSVVEDLRVLALVASPLEVGPADAVTVAATIVPPPGGAVTAVAWSFCPFSVGASAGYACALPACEVPLTAAADGSVTFVPGALALQCLSLAASQGGTAGGIPQELPDVVQTVVRCVATASDGEVREAVQEIPLHPSGPPADPNRPPVVIETDLGGQPVSAGATGPPLLPGSTLAFRVLLDPASAQSYLDTGGNTLTESLVVSFYTTAGRFDYDRASGPDASVNLQYQSIVPGTAEAQLWAVARDLRGGNVVLGPFHVPIGP